MKRIAAFFVLLALVLAVFSGCSGSSAGTVKVAALKGPTGMGMSKLMEDAGQGQSANSYEFTLAGSADVVSSGLINGDFDIAALPTNTIANLYAKTGGEVLSLAVNTLGVLYILSDEPVSSLSDLSGRTICAAGRGTVAQYVTDYILAENGLTDGENISMEYASEHAEVVAKALSGGCGTVVLPEPFVTNLMLQSSDFQIVADLTLEWSKLGGGELAMGGIAVRRGFAEEHPEAVSDFLTEYAASVAYCNENPAEAAALIEKYDIMTAAAAEKAIPNCNMVCITGEEMKSCLTGFYTVLFGLYPDSIGGELPDGGLYFTAG